MKDGRRGASKTVSATDGDKTTTTTSSSTDWNNPLKLSNRSSNFISQKDFLKHQVDNSIQFPCATSQNRHPALKIEANQTRYDLTTAQELVEVGLADKAKAEREPRLREEEVEGLQLEVEQLKVEVNTGREEAVKLGEEILNTNNLLDDEMVSRHAIERDLKEKEEELAAKELQLADCRKNLEAVTQICNTRETEKKKLGDEAKACKGEIAGLKSVVNRLKAEVDGWREELGKLREDVKEIGQKFDAEKDHRVSIEKLLEEKGKELEKKEKELGACQKELARETDSNGRYAKNNRSLEMKLILAHVQLDMRHFSLLAVKWKSS
ncbi:hypothetical protein HDU76_004556 [Blyttiomyces sp. JEL0837]|nr:hypothetical protein HDU76_004556 [Blyttiomyces sp. JEL0837]